MVLNSKIYQGPNLLGRKSYIYFFYVKTIGSNRIGSRLCLGQMVTTLIVKHSFAIVKHICICNW